MKEIGFCPEVISGPLKELSHLDCGYPDSFHVQEDKSNPGKYILNSGHRIGVAKVLGIKEVEAYVNEIYIPKHTQQEYEDFVKNTYNKSCAYNGIDFPYGVKLTGRDNWEKMYGKYFRSLPASYFTGRKVLDVGCNIGGLSFFLLQHGANVTGVDINKQAIDIANKISYFEFPGRDIKFICSSMSDIDSLKLPKFHTAFVNQSIYHATPSGEEVLEKISSLCIESLFMFTNLSSSLVKCDLDFPGQFIPTLDELKDFLKRNNFRKLILLQPDILSILSKNKNGCRAKTSFIALKEDYIAEIIPKNTIAVFIDLISGKSKTGTKDCMTWKKKEATKENKKGEKIV